MKRMFIAGNWKMNHDFSSGALLMKSLREGLARETADGVTVVICPPFVLLDLARTILNASAIELGAQNVHHADNGAYTGEISAAMLVSAGCRRVIVGHSERRQFFHESDEIVNRKARKALDSSLEPIICTGETLEQREKNETTQVIERQLLAALEDFSDSDALRSVIAYEPVWAIGTGRTASPDQAQEVHALIRSLLSGRFSAKTANAVPILYGGSVKPDNALHLFRQTDINGGLIGGASLKSDEFLSIVRAGREAIH